MTPLSAYNGRTHFEPKVRHNGEWVEKRNLSDAEIILHSRFSAELPDSFIPVPDTEVPDTRARRVLGDYYLKFKELYNRHRSLVWFKKIMPTLTTKVFIAPTATVIGDVIIGDFSSIWYGAIVRGDKNHIHIGSHTNVQDGAIITTDDRPNLAGLESSVKIGNYVTIGHGARLHACTIGNHCLIGMNATILEGAVVEQGAAVAAGSLVPPGRLIPHGQLWAGNPAKFLRKIGYKEEHAFEFMATQYEKIAETHDLEFTAQSPAFREVEKIIATIDSVLPEAKPDPLVEAEKELRKQEYYSWPNDDDRERFQYLPLGRDNPIERH